MASSKGSSPAAASSQAGLTSGVVNPSGFAVAAFTGVFAAFIPVTSYLAKPNGWVESTVGLSLRLIPGAATIAKDRHIAALAALYVFVAMPLGGAFSAAAQAAGRQDGLDNNTPRAHTPNLRGLPLRIYSAHHNILENLPLWALAAALTQSLNPTNPTAINLLGLAALTKIFIYIPAYVLDIAPLRTLSHVIHTSAVINVLWKLAVGSF